MSDPNDSKELRALSYTEMMNSGRQDFNNDEDQHQNELERRLEALEKKVLFQINLLMTMWFKQCLAQLQFNQI